MTSANMLETEFSDYENVKTGMPLDELSFHKRPFCTYQPSLAIRLLTLM